MIYKNIKKRTEIIRRQIYDTTHCVIMPDDVKTDYDKRLLLLRCIMLKYDSTKYMSSLSYVPVLFLAIFLMPMFYITTIQDCDYCNESLGKFISIIAFFVFCTGIVFQYDLPEYIAVKKSLKWLETNPDIKEKISKELIKKGITI